MKIFDANISPLTHRFFIEKLFSDDSLDIANNKVRLVSGICCFFETITDFYELKRSLSAVEKIESEADRADYGDFQTNMNLAIAVTNYILKHSDEPDFIVEPTCGKGNFIISALQIFKSLKKVYGVEIYRPYVWETKFSILHFFLENPHANKPEINIFHCNVFDFDFKAIASGVSAQKVLVIGNPPWVTNSTLGSLNSSNLPAKSNFKRHNGLDAITGKGNFDIAEYIATMMLDAFENQNGNIALLVKSSVIKNIVFEQKRKKYKIGDIEKHCINSKKEFNVSVDAAFFFCQLNVSPSLKCYEFDFYNNSKPVLNFGWIEEKFVSNIKTYVHSKHIDGCCPFEWRQGLKHDCSAIMELDRVGDYYVNGLNEKTELESELVYGILKSSDLKNPVVSVPRKYTIVTQRKIGQDTSYIKRNLPKTYQYLIRHQDSFDTRKSIIYKNKPSFSIFGIGDYSFKPFKVVISGLYKSFHFTLVLPDNQKPMMLDDTCYVLGFDDFSYAVYTFILLNSQATKKFLQAITFSDAKRTFTKDILMRIDLFKLSNELSFDELNREIEYLNKRYSLNATTKNWNAFISIFKREQNSQIVMFA
jgi:hypothetical protein